MLPLSTGLRKIKVNLHWLRSITNLKSMSIEIGELRNLQSVNSDQYDIFTDLEVYNGNPGNTGPLRTKWEDSGRSN